MARETARSSVRLDDMHDDGFHHAFAAGEPSAYVVARVNAHKVANQSPEVRVVLHFLLGDGDPHRAHGGNHIVLERQLRRCQVFLIDRHAPTRRLPTLGDLDK